VKLRLLIDKQMEVSAAISAVMSTCANIRI
jgi:hypothetical protein